MNRSDDKIETRQHFIVPIEGAVTENIDFCTLKNSKGRVEGVERFNFLVLRLYACLIEPPAYVATLLWSAMPK